jgi:hypothetical protein
MLFGSPRRGLPFATPVFARQAGLHQQMQPKPEKETKSCLKNITVGLITWKATRR